MLKRKLQYFDHLMQTANSLEKSLITGKDWGQEKREAEEEMAGWHHLCNDVNLDKLWKMVRDREAWRATVEGLQRVRRDCVTEQQQT